MLIAGINEMTDGSRTDKEKMIHSTPRVDIRFLFLRMNEDHKLLIDGR